MRLALVACSSLLAVASCHRERSHHGASQPDRVEAAGPSTTDLEELHAFARLYGYVRFFHPSDEAAALDWDGFAIHGVRRVTEGSDREALRVALEELFGPVAPTLDVYVEGQRPREASTLFPADTEGLEAVSWQHRGFGFGDMVSAYTSKRTNRRSRLAVGQASSVSVTQELPAEALRGKVVRLRAWARVDAEASAAGVRLIVRATQTDRPPRSRASSPQHRELRWGELSVEHEIPSDATTVTLGATVGGRGAAWVDDFTLEVREGEGWRELPLTDAGFEQADELEPWSLDAPNFEHQLRAQAHGGERALWLARKTVAREADLFEERPEPGELLDASLGAGLRVQVPLSLYSKDEHTLAPPGSEPRPVPSFEAVPRSAEDPAVRVAAVVVAWNVFQHFHPYFDAIDADWPAVLDYSLARAQRDASPAETLETLQRMVSALHDGHGWVQAPFPVDEQRVPVSLARAEGRIVVSTAPEGQPLRRGDVVLRYEGRDVEEALADAAALVSGSPQWVEFRLLTWSGLTRGAPGSMARFEIERGGETMTVEIERRDLEAPPVFEHEPLEELDGGLYYVDLSRLPWEELAEVLPQLSVAPGVVFDLRRYPEGSNFMILSHLMTEPEHDQWMHVARIIRPDRAGPVEWEGMGWDLSPTEPRIRGKVAFITGGGAISYAESMMGYVEGLHLAEIVGEPTAGANGNVNPFTVPGGYTLTSTGMRVVKHDGSPHHVVGITPTVPVSWTLAGISEGRDELFERAVAVVSSD